MKDTFLINRFKKLLQKTQKILSSFEESNIDKSFKEKYKEDILKRINKLFNNLML
jgi:hypothetical protein